MLQLVGRHQRPHARAQSQAQRHGRQPLEVEIAGRPPQVAVEHKVCAQPPPPALEVHQQEGEVVEQIDGGERLVELDGVEQHRLPLPQHDVVEVQVAVHAPHAACCRAPRKAGARTGELGPCCPLEGLSIRLGKNRRVPGKARGQLRGHGP